MMLRSLRGLAIFGAVAVAFLATPPESKAIFHWFRNCFRPVTTYQPVVAAPTCNPCAQPAVQYAPRAQPAVQYVPQTAYRRQIVNVPVTALQQVVTTDPCTGCPVTTCRPVTTCLRQVRLVPYTTYRVVQRRFPRVRAFFAPAPVAAPAAANCCGPATGTYGTPATLGAPVSVSTPAYGFPSTPAPNYSSPGLSPTPAPSLPPGAAIPASPESSAARTYQESSPTRVESRSLRPLSQPQQQEPARPADPNDAIGPQLNAPTSGTTNQPIPHTWTHSQSTWPYSQVTWPPHVASRQASELNERPSPRQPTMELDNSGWRASSR